MSQTFGPYSPIRKAGNTYYISGQIGVDPKTALAPIKVTDQTEQALRNLETVLRSKGLQLQDVIKTTLFLTNMDHFSAVNEVYLKRFEAPRPARSAVCVKELPRVSGDRPILIEIEAVAYKDQS